MEMLAGPLQKVGLQLLLQPEASSVLFRAGCNTAAIVYPVYSSFKAIEDKKDPNNDTQWLTYWTIYGLLSLVEFPFDRTLAGVPYYYHLKFAALLWLQLPQTKGAQLIYQRVIAPTLKKYQEKIDVCIATIAHTGAVAYNLYRGPIDAGLYLAALAVQHVVDFYKWFTSSSGSKSVADDAKDSKPQFLVN